MVRDFLGGPPWIPMAAQAFRHHILGKPLPPYATLKLTPTVELAISQIRIAEYPDQKYVTYMTLNSSPIVTMDR